MVPKCLKLGVGDVLNIEKQALFISGIGIRFQIKGLLNPEFSFSNAYPIVYQKVPPMSIGKMHL